MHAYPTFFLFLYFINKVKYFLIHLNNFINFLIMKIKIKILHYTEIINM